MVSPEVRRRGVGRLLLATLEAAAWSQGERELTLETHADWSAALRLYEACGYARIP
jgi:GNAT superfamily N-acetyltransferase